MRTKEQTMWYEKELNKEIDGMEAFLSLFKTTEEFYNHFFNSIKFFKQHIVKEQSALLLKNIEEKQKIPVRFTMKSNTVFRIPTDGNQRGFIKKTFKNKKEAHDFAEVYQLVHTQTGINVRIDKDNTYYIKKEILSATGHKVSTGSKSNLFNYTISHVWGNTENPLFFSSLWNIVLIPTYLSYILDKPSSTNPITHKIKTLVKAACFDLYKPNELMKREIIVVDERLENSVSVLRKLIEGKLITINYLESKKQ